MAKIVKVMEIVSDSVVDGAGFRDVVYVAGCHHHCKECHNPECWDFNHGKDMDIMELYLRLAQNSIANVTFSGGEPFMQAESLAELARLLKTYTKKNIWIYSGYTFEEIIADPVKMALLELCDVLVDGKFLLEQRDSQLLFRGSANQRLIRVADSLKVNKIVPWQQRSEL